MSENKQGQEADNPQRHGSEMSGGNPHPEQHPVHTRSVLMTSGILGWRALRSFGRWLTKSNEPEEEKRKPQLESPIGRVLVEGAEAGVKAAQLTAAAIEKVIQDATAAEMEHEGSEPFDRREDRNLDLEDAVDVAGRERWGTFLVSLAMGVMFAGGIGFLWIYWTGGNNLLLGANLAFFFAGLGCALVFWAQLLTVQKQAVMAREPLSSRPKERAATAEVYEMGAHEVHRRRLLKLMAGAGGAFAATFVVSLMKSLGFPPGTALYTHVWNRGQRLMKLDKTPVSVNSMEPGDMMLVFPENAIGSEKTQTVLIRVNEQLLRMPPGRKDWAPHGFVAYSRICTHAGCNVGMYEATTHLLMCPCHQSTFDVLDGAQPTGGPAARPLPQLPLYVDGDGFLRAADGFSNPPGPGFWGMPS